jgi:glycosyltransferase involved in cell wall biosynthesis
MKLSIVIPFYNEAKNVPLVLDSFNELAKTHSDFELICVNDGSKDNTAEVLDAAKRSGTYPFMEYITYFPNGGYGNAIMTGVRAAKGDVICWTHSDMQTDPADVFRALQRYEELTSGSNSEKILVKGKRVNRPLPQVLFSFGMATIASCILRKRLFEINAQPKLFPRSFIPLLNNAPKEFSLDLYLLCIAKKNHYAIHAIDVEFKNRLHGESSWGGSFKNRLKTIWRTLKYIWRLRTEV